MLPDLPRVLKKREADWTTDKLEPYLKKLKRTCAWEVKHTRGKSSLNFNLVTPGQIKFLSEVRHGVYVRKNPDMGEATHFDGQCLVGEPAYIIIKYPLGFVFIDVDTFILESKRSKRRSLTWSRACDIAVICVDK